MTVALLVLLIVPVVLGTVLARRAQRALAVSPDQRTAMYRTAFGFAAAPASDGAETTARHRSPTILVASIVPFAASGILAAFAAPHQVKQLWVFSCRLFGH